MLEAQVGRDRLKRWLIEQAAPLWASTGWRSDDAVFLEAIGQDGQAVNRPFRGRVTPRQLYAFAVAERLGATLPDGLLTRGCETMVSRFQRPDGLFRTLVADDGAPLDDSVSLYDQAFVLLALATLRGKAPNAEETAVRLRHALIERLKYADGGFHEAIPPVAPLGSNPHMHLFESFLTWDEAGGDGDWRKLADEVASLALERFIDPTTGALREFFALDWTPAPGKAGRLVEPGHQFEWAWLLLRWDVERAGEAAARLIEIGEAYGVDPSRGVAFNGLWDDLTAKDEIARLWPQTERLKANVSAAVMLNDPAGWQRAAEAVSGLEAYLNTPVAGLWRDRMNPDGSFIEEPAPASSFYHIVCAIDVLDRDLKRHKT